MHSRYIFAALVCATFTTSMASQTDSEKRGYWWGEREALEETKQDDTNPYKDLAAPPSDAELTTMHPKQVEKLLDDYRQYALWKMTPEHVSWYYQIQDFARRRAQAFVNTTQYVMLSNGALNMNAEYPQTTPGIDARQTQQQADIDLLLEQGGERAALILLTRESCPYCQVQRNTLTYFQQKHPGWQIREFDIEKEPSVKARFSAEATPTTVVIFRDSQKWFPVSVGVESVTGVEQNVFRALRLLQGDTDASQFTMQSYQKGGLLDPKGK